MRAFAEDPDFPLIPLQEFDIDIITILNGIFEIIWPIIIAVTIIVFIWAGISFLTAAGDPTKISTAKKAVIWGVVGVIVLVLSYSIIGFVNNFLG